MPPATEWSAIVLQSVRGGLLILARRVANPEEPSAPASAQPHQDDGALFGPGLVALKALEGEPREMHIRLTRLEEAGPLAPVPPDRRENDPMGPLFDALEAISSELTAFAARLAQLEDTTSQAPCKPQGPWLMGSPRASATTVRTARRGRARTAVSHA